MSHSDTIKELPDGGVLLASTEDVENAAFKIEGEHDLCYSISSRGIPFNRWSSIAA
jgi:hypothetical protein